MISTRKDEIVGKILLYRDLRGWQNLCFIRNFILENFQKFSEIANLPKKKSKKRKKKNLVTVIVGLEKHFINVSSIYSWKISYFPRSRLYERRIRS